MKRSSSRLAGLLVTLIMLLGLGVAFAPASGAAAVTVDRNACIRPATATEGRWDAMHPSFIYKWNGDDVGAAARWCINDNGSRLVMKANGELILFNRAVSGGSVVWRSGTANQGGAEFDFQSSDGNMVIRDKYSHPIWALSWINPGVLFFQGCPNQWVVRTFQNRWEWWRYSASLGGTCGSDGYPRVVLP